jgi:hypothetical protein
MHIAQDLAQQYGLLFFDFPFCSGGVFFNARDWGPHGYAICVEVSTDESGTGFRLGRIDKPSEELRAHFGDGIEQTIESEVEDAYNLFGMTPAKDHLVITETGSKAVQTLDIFLTALSD